jgi:Zn-dependent protease with chaperone function
MYEAAQNEGAIAGREKPPTLMRRLDASFWLTLLAVLPQVFSSLMILSVLGAEISPQATWILPVTWIASAGLVFLPGVEELLIRVGHHVRRPSPAERARLHPQWLIVTQAAHLDPTRFSLWVEDSRECNAFAAGGRTVIVTREALALPDRQLAAILAHEVGHHLSNHPVADLLARWCALPAKLAVVVTRLVIVVVVWLGRLFAYLSNGVSILVAGVTVVILLAALLTLNPWLIIAPILAIGDAAASRKGEFAADRTAARLGFGPDLLLVLRSFMANEHSSTPDRLRSRLLASHPPLPTRLARLERLLGTTR